jgi:hypothetical protein
VRRAAWTIVLGASALGVLAVASGACGARTELGAPELADANDEVRDATREADAAEEDAIDELPTIDQFVDAPIPTDCPDAGATLVYLISGENDLYSFYPPTLAFTKIGTIACTPNSQPYSMAVDRTGTAYSVFADGSLWQIDTANASCKGTSYVPAQQNEPFHNFGMGYAGDQNGETLYVADANFNVDSLGLATIDTKTFTRDFIADFQPELPRCELTGTGDGRLFAFCLFTSGTGSQIAEVDRNTAKVIAINQLAVGDASDAFAYAFWGGEFWIFTGPSKTTTVTEYDPGTLTETNVATINATIVGAGVSTCAPQ